MSLLSRDQDSDLKEGGINLTSMIDMLFLLIIFFIVTSAIVKEEIDHTIQLPESRQLEALVSPQKSVIINIRKDGSIRLGKKELTLAELEIHLKAIYEKQKGRTIEVYGDRDLTLQKCFPVLDVVKSVGFTKYSLKGEIKGL